MSDAGKTTTTTTPINEELAELMLVRPTLFIGLGGTGAAILTALRRRIMQRLWNRHRLESVDDFKVASFLYFDTFAGPAKDQEARKAENEPDDPIAPLVELQKADCMQAGLNPMKYLKRDAMRGTAELDSYPEVKAWLPAEELSAINLEEGAGQIRAMSRLLFFDRVSEIQSQVSSKVSQLRNNLKDQIQLRDLGLKTTNKVNVKIIGSAAGGTGSGAFIDVGYLARSLKDPAPDEVSLWLVLGGAFSGQGPRVLANTYAALAEIEFAMKLRPGDQPFVKKWDARLGPDAIRPFDRLYMFDSSNTGGVGVSQDGRDYVFRMIADLLLQEFAEPDLVGARRADQSNQDTKYRAPMYAPSVTRQYGDQGLEYSRLYSGVGQSSVETRGRIEFQAQGAEVAIGMLRSYFRTESGQVAAPKPAAVDDFLNDRLFVGPMRQFSVHKDLRSAPVLSDYPLVFSKLLAKDGTSLLESIQNDVAADFGTLLASPMSEWPVRSQDIKKQRRSEIEQESVEKVGTTLRTRGVDEAFKKLNGEINGPAGTLRQGILGLIDSDIGGISYAQQFVEALKAKLIAHWIPLFRRDADTFGDLATKVMSQLYDQAAENLQKESKGGLFSSPNRPRMETLVNQLKDTLTTWMQYRLRQIACSKAADLLDSACAALGESKGAGADGKPLFSGILRDIGDGLSTIEETIADLQREAKLIRDPDAAHNPIHQVIGVASSAPALVVDDAAYRALAAQAFANYGGATKLFEELRDREKRAKILSRVRTVASRENGPSGKPILPAEAEVPSLIDELAALPRGKQEEVITRAVSQGMPWVNIAKGTIGSAWSEDMNSIFICVQDRERFKSLFGDMIKKAVRSYVDATKEINYVESASQGKLSICTELSGLPLDAMIQLHDEWFRQYESIREDSKQAPLHTHKEWEKFAHPTAPDAAEMRARLDDVALFVQGVGFGLLRRRTAAKYANSPDKIGQYEINLKAGLTANNWVPIGRELKVKNFGLKSDHRDALQNDLRSLTDKLSVLQLLGSVALFEHYTQTHYAPRLVGKDELARAGLGHLASETLVSSYIRRLRETPDGRSLASSDDVLEAHVKALLNNVNEWTIEIEGSLDDVDGMEANKDPDTDYDRRARPKRTIRQERFVDELLRVYAGIQTTAPIPPNSNVIDVKPSVSYYVATDGQAKGPFGGLELTAMATRGELLPTSMVYDAEQGDKWLQAAAVPALSALFARRSQSRPPPPPPPASSSSG